MSFLFAAIFAGSAQAADPACPIAPPAFGEAVQAARSARGDAFAPAYAEVRTLLRCLSGPLDTEQAAALHQLEALSAFRARNLGDVVDHFQAATLTLPGIDVGAPFPAGHAMTDLAAEAGARIAPLRQDVDVAADHSTRVDGRLATSRPEGLPTIVQVLGPDGTVLWSDLVAADAHPPSFVAAAQLSRKDKALRATTLGGTATLAALSAVAWTVSLGTRSQMRGIAETAHRGAEAPLAQAELQSLQGKANSWGVVAQVASGATLALGATTVVVWF